MIFKRKAAAAAKAAALLGLSLTLPACATIVRGTTQEVTFQSSPPNAKVATTNGFRCDATPCNIRVPRKEPFSVNFAREGFEPAVVHLDSKKSIGAVFLGATGNVLIFGGLIGMLFDDISGAFMEITPNPVSVELKPVEAPSISDAPLAAEAPSDPEI